LGGRGKNLCVLQLKLGAIPSDRALDRRTGTPRQPQGLSPDIAQIGDVRRRRGGLRRRDVRPVGPGAQDLRQLGQRGHPVRGVAVAVGMLVATGQLPPDCTSTLAICGELGLNGSLRHVPGMIALADATAPLELVARLAHGGLGQTHDGETGQAVGDMDLHRDRLAQGAGQGRRRDTSEQAEERLPARRLLPGHIRP